MLIFERKIHILKSTKAYVNISSTCKGASVIFEISSYSTEVLEIKINDL